MKEQAVFTKIFNAMAPKPNLNKLITKHGLAGLQTFLDRGGEFNPGAKSYKGTTELMDIVRRCGKEGLELYFAHGGKPNPGVAGEAKEVAESGGVDALALYAKKGGLFNRTDKKEVAAIKKAIAEAKAHLDFLADQKTYTNEVVSDVNDVLNEQGKYLSMVYKKKSP